MKTTGAKKQEEKKYNFKKYIGRYLRAEQRKKLAKYKV
jgi:hypothetical protein